MHLLNTSSSQQKRSRRGSATSLKLPFYQDPPVPGSNHHLFERRRLLIKRAKSRSLLTYPKVKSNAKIILILAYLRSLTSIYCQKVSVRNRPCGGGHHLPCDEKLRARGLDKDAQPNPESRPNPLPGWVGSESPQIQPKPHPLTA